MERSTIRGLCYWALIAMVLLVVAPAVPDASAEDSPAEEQSAIVSEVSEDELDAQRGGEAVSLNETTLDATMQDNTITSSITGTNSINGDAFTGANGFVTVIQNSGNQVIIQDSTIVNLTLQ